MSRELAGQETLICRCEELTLTDIASGFAASSRSIGANKRLTRAGMGRCQGRYCGPVLATIAACDSGALPDEAAHWAPRPPVKPMLISEISGLGSGNHTE